MICTYVNDDVYMEYFLASSITVFTILFFRPDDEVKKNFEIYSSQYF